MQTVRKLSLKVQEAELSTDCVTQQGIQVKVLGVVMFKVADDMVSIANAARRFLDQSPEVTKSQIQAVFDGHLRSIIGGLTMEDLIRNRDALTGETRKAAGADMEKLGFGIDSLQIQKISDPSGYIDSLAAPHVAEVKKNARIAQAQADQDATKAEQETAANKAQFERDSQTKQAQYQADVASAQAKSAQAGPLADATAKQEVVVAATKTAELMAAQKEQELQVSVRKPADAAAYAVRVKAEADRDAQIANAQAQAQQTQLEATAQANATEVTGKAQASAIQVKGEAEGAAVRAKALAEADGIKARAQALSENQEAVIGQTLAQNMPEIVKEAAGVFSHVDNLVVFNGAEGVNQLVTGVAGLASTLLPQFRQALGKGADTNQSAS